MGFRVRAPCCLSSGGEAIVMFTTNIARIVAVFLGSPYRQTVYVICKATGMADETVREALKRLVRNGWCGVERERGRWNTGLYYSLTPYGRKQGTAELVNLRANIEV